MNVYCAACDLVRALLEDGQPVKLKPSKDWDTFTRALPGYRRGHGMKEFLKHVASDDVPYFCDVMLSLGELEVMVPSEKWCLKMPYGYGIYGKGDQGVSVLGKKEAVVSDSRVVNNPAMTEVQNRTWRQGL